MPKPGCYRAINPGTKEGRPVVLWCLMFSAVEHGWKPFAHPKGLYYFLRAGGTDSCGAEILVFPSTTYLPEQHGVD